MQSSAERGHPPPFCRRPRGGRRRAARRTVPRRADPAQGPRSHPGGGALLRGDGLCSGGRLPRRARQPRGAAFQEGGLRRPRPDQHPRARNDDHDRAARLRGDAQSLEHRALAWRFLGRCRRGRRLRHGSRRPRHRRRRLDPRPGELLCPFRAEAQPWPSEQGTGAGRVVVRVLDRPRRSAHGSRLGGRAGPDRRLLPG